jgi:hypothetical protein
VKRLLHAAEIMERRAAVALGAVGAALADVRSRRFAIHAESLAARQAVREAAHWTGFSCAVLSNHMLRSALAAERLAGLGSELMTRGYAVAKTKLRWAKVRAGLARRTQRTHRHG